MPSRLVAGPIFAALIALFLAVPVRAAGLVAPAGEVVLTVTGAIGVTNGDGAARFDMAMIEALPRHEFTTTTIWTQDTHRFTGVLLADLLAAVGARGTTLRAVALNDYSVTVPVSDAVPDGPLVAYRIDGAAMPVRDKGPLWIVYPYDARVEYQSETIYARSIWQLSRIEVGD